MLSIVSGHDNDDLHLSSEFDEISSDGENSQPLELSFASVDVNHLQMLNQTSNINSTCEGQSATDLEAAL